MTEALVNWRYKCLDLEQHDYAFVALSPYLFALTFEGMHTLDVVSHHHHISLLQRNSFDEHRSIVSPRTEGGYIVLLCNWVVYPRRSNYLAYVYVKKVGNEVELSVIIREDLLDNTYLMHLAELRLHTDAVIICDYSFAYRRPHRLRVPNAGLRMPSSLQAACCLAIWRNNVPLDVLPAIHKQLAKSYTFLFTHNSLHLFW